jgi:hypothetical protein
MDQNFTQMDYNVLSSTALSEPDQDLTFIYTGPYTAQGNTTATANSYQKLNQ